MSPVRSQIPSFALALMLAACATTPTTTPTTTICEREPGVASTPPQPMAKAAEPKQKAPLRYADANHDGKVTREEASVDRALAAAFDRYDKNGDGVLDRAEFAQFVADNDRSHPRPRQEFAAVEQAPAAPAPAVEWRCHEVNGERVCPGARIRATATD